MEIGGRSERVQEGSGESWPGAMVVWCAACALPCFLAADTRHLPSQLPADRDPPSSTDEGCAGIAQCSRDHVRRPLTSPSKLPRCRPRDECQHGMHQHLWKALPEDVARAARGRMLVSSAAARAGSGTLLTCICIVARGRGGDGGSREYGEDAEEGGSRRTLGCSSS